MFLPIDARIALSTVYRKLKALSEVGLVITTPDADGETVYDIAHEH